ncbi:DUF262 domain-containing protein [Pseudorhodoplanes sp.]|uniref:DUF262 domain-containing protein n=1 Tax=Pseudorhodoplanes sp. TaxID=1934341 RepID=UPI00391A7431
MSEEKPIFETELDTDIPDPDEPPLKDRKVITQPYDLVVESLSDQIKGGTIFLRPLSDRPNFQRQYVWTDALASKLIESILLNVPIPPCYLSQNEEFELDVIDGQQRLYSIYRFLDNQFKLAPLEVLKEFSGKRFYELPTKTQRQLKTHTLRCILITNESHPDIKFDVFERLNTNTVPLNAQELRNCVYRGSLNSMLKSASEYAPWLEILKRKKPDIRLRDEEIILRFFAFDLHGLDSYRTPQKHWLNDAAKAGQKYSDQKINSLLERWKRTIDTCRIWFDATECFRREKSKVVNRALFDLVTSSAKDVPPEAAKKARINFRAAYSQLEGNEEFQDLISRAVDHTSRTKRRFEIWRANMMGIL